MKKLCRNSNGAKMSRNRKTGKDEGASETTFTVLYKNVLITLQTKLRQKGRGQYPGSPPWHRHWSKWFAFSAASGQAIIRFALNVSLFKVQQKLCLIVIFAFSVYCSIKKFRFQNFFCFVFD